MGDWAVYLNGVGLGGCAAIDCPGVALPAGILTTIPDGLGLPGLRTEDVDYPQRDGVEHFSDWYQPRILTFQASVCGGCGCGPNPESGMPTREAVKVLARAWDRQCGDTELVLYTDCHGNQPDIDPLAVDGYGFGPYGDGPYGDPDVLSEAYRVFNGPYGVIGRPRVFQATPAGGTHCYDLLLRFDAVDQRMYVLDECGTPGSGLHCEVLSPTTSASARCYDLSSCYPKCYTDDLGNTIDPTTVTVLGDTCPDVTITLHGPLTGPIRVQNTTTGESLTYAGTIGVDDQPVTINPREGTATQGSSNRTALVSGRFSFMLGDNVIRLQSSGPSDTGTANVCWRTTVTTG